VPVFQNYLCNNYTYNFYNFSEEEEEKESSVGRDERRKGKGPASVLLSNLSPFNFLVSKSN